MARRVGDQFMGKHVDRYDPVDRVAYSFNLLANLPHIMARMLATVQTDMDNLQPIRRDQFLMLEALNSEVLGAAALLDS